MDEWYFMRPDFWSTPELIVLFTGSIFAIVLMRYLVLAWVYKSASRRFPRSPINAESQAAKMQWRREIRWSAISSAVFAVLAVLTFLAYQHGYTRIYTDVTLYPGWYFAVTVVVMLVLYETYYYWLHRWMHKPSVYRIVHKVHHDSVHTSVFTSFSFHPIEALLQFLFLPVMICLMPVHPYAIGTVLMLMTLSAIVNHAGVEIFPAGFRNHRIGRWLIGATHHDLHHKEFRTNFGLYFTFWDKWMNTESRNYETAFSKNTKSAKEA